MKLLPTSALCATAIMLVLTAPAPCKRGSVSVSEIRTAENRSVKLSAKDLATADGSCRVGLHNGKIYCILTGSSSDIELVPDSWSSDDESKNWNNWLVDFDNALFSKWLEFDPGDGQETVQVRIANGAITQTNGQFIPAPYVQEAAVPNGPRLNASQQTAFEFAIQQSLLQTFKSAIAVPQTKNPLKEVRIAVTFMRDSEVVPRYGKRELGFASTTLPPTGNLVVYGRMKEGRVPGIQIISDRDGGSIQITDLEPFMRKCDEIDLQTR